MRRLLAVLPLVLCVGCFTSGKPQPKSWTLEPTSVPAADLSPEKKSPPAFATTRVGTVAVAAPFDRTLFVVRRADGSVAFDAYNEFAAAPSALLRAPVRAQLATDGRFGHVVTQSSTASSDASVDAVSVDVVRTGRGARMVALSADGASEADASSGDFSTAFSKAFNEALAEALKVLR